MMSVRPLSKFLQEKAKTELNENNVEENLKIIRSWLNSQPHIVAGSDDQWLVNFLRGTKFNIEKTKEKLDMYYSCKTDTPELFNNRDPFLPEMQELLDLGVFVCLPTTNDKGERILILKIGEYDPTRIKPQDFYKFATMIIDVMILDDDGFTIAGVQTILNMEKSGMGHYIRYSYYTNLLRKLFYSLMRAYPARPKGVHFTNVPATFSFLYRLVRPLMPAKIKERVVISSDNSLGDGIPVELLPYEYGGNAGSFDEIKEQMKKKVESYRDWFLENEKYGTDESKRPKSAKKYFWQKG